MDKSKGETSFDVVRKMRRVSGEKKVGHAGTLDPFSTGLIVVMLGRGTRLSQFLMSGRKRYVATICLGTETDTYDPDGRVVSRQDVPEMEPGFLEEALKGFIGEIDQAPPIFSAVHVNGERAYKLARKGRDVELPKRKVTIHEIKLLSVDLPELVVEVVCSRGTYLRSLAFDLGRTLKVGAHLSSLRRIASGSFSVEDAIQSDELSGSLGRREVMDHLISLADALPDATEIRVTRAMAAKIRNGYKPTKSEILSGAFDMEGECGLFRFLCDGELIAVFEMAASPQGNEKNSTTMRVFH